MFRQRPGRLRTFSYRGLQRYHVRAATHNRLPVFVDTDVVARVREQLFAQAESCSFAVLAYCFMPDHVHLLVEARADDAWLPEFVAAWKQQSGYGYASAGRGRLWQVGYFERVLRNEESTSQVAAYILGNPVRAGLAQRVSDYPHAWSLWGTDPR
jgi:putative transposase